ncbi:beta-galactosidase [Gracilibacillus sp. Marseille-QA3620]
MELTNKTYITQAREMLHGGDYNPDQWLDYPEIIHEDFRLMKMAKANTFSLGIFAWSALEPEEGVYRFEWLDDIFDRIEAMGGNIILATPSGARPAWMSQKYPEVLRVSGERVKQLHGGRHNHCFTSPVYRDKTAQINKRLAERYQDRKGLLMWHISNEYGGECHCDKCLTAFRGWLKEKYNGDLKALNDAWWGPFWSHTFTDWEQIESPSKNGENTVHGLNLDWRRFVTDQTINFYQNEIRPLREITPAVPITTNYMADTFDLIPFQSLNYGEFSKHLDVISFDCYPAWHNDWESTDELAMKVGFINDLYRSIKQQPFLIMECTPSLVNWHEVNKAKRPGMHRLSSMQFISHGADSVLYFQWRKSRGSSEKLHGAVIDHDGSENNRVFKEVASVGEMLQHMQPIVGTNRPAEAAIIYDWENNWALNDAQGFNNKDKKYPQTLQQHYRAFWDRNIPVDVCTPDMDLSSYKLVIAPMMYLIQPGFAEKITEYVKDGGHFVTTYMTGMVNENDLTFLGGFPGPLKDVLGLTITETDTLYPSEIHHVSFNGRQYKAHDYCAQITLETAVEEASYMDDFYAGAPALAVNSFGAGKSYFIASRNERAFHTDFYGKLAVELGLSPVLEANHETGVSIQARVSESETFYFVMNFTEEEQKITFKDKEAVFTDLETGEAIRGEIVLPQYGCAVLRK